MPASHQMLLKVQENILAPTTKGTSVSITTFHGSGLPSSLDYLTSKEQNSFLQSRQVGVFWLHMTTFQINPEECLRDSLFNFSNNFEALLTGETRSLIKERLNTSSALSVQEFLQFLQILSSEFKLKLTIIFHNLTASSDIKQVSLMNGLFKLNHQQISYIFHCISSTSLYSENNLGLLYSFYLGNRLMGRDFLMGEEDFDVIFDTVASDLDLGFNKSLRKNISSLCRFDPYIAKYFIMETTRNEALASALSASEIVGYKEVSEFVNEEVIKDRFDKIFRHLAVSDVDSLENTAILEKSYLFESGLFLKKETGFGPQNPVLEKFLTYAKKYNPRSLFTGQQQVIYDYLSKYAGEIVSKEDIAQVVWGADWEEKYSAQTLDKQISNIRKQLSVSDLKQEIITLRDQGYILKSIE